MHLLSVVEGNGNFYPRPPRGGRRRCGAACAGRRDFYPRPPRGGRPMAWFMRSTEVYFYPRPPRGGRRPASRVVTCPTYFYPRPPRGGRLSRPPGPNVIPNNFYPRPPRGGRRSWCAMWWTWTNFYPRPPRGGRPLARQRPRRPGQFLSTPSARRATGDILHLSRPEPISIHALREEGDSKCDGQMRI